MTDTLHSAGHYPTYQEMLTKVNWERYGVVNGVARDPRCENCMVHCGYDPSGALGTNYQRGDNWKNFKYNFSARPKPFPGDAALAKRVFNGASIGKGHLAEAKSAVQATAASDNNGDGQPHVGTFCGSPESETLPAGLPQAKKGEAQ